MKWNNKFLKFIFEKDILFYLIFASLSVFTFFVLFFNFNSKLIETPSLVGENKFFIPVKFQKYKKFTKNNYKKNLEKNQNHTEKENIREFDFIQNFGSEGILKNSYIAKILQKIEENKNYPQMELLMEKQGIVKVHLVILKSGKIEKIEIIEGTTKNFIEETIASIKKSQPFDPIPDELNLDKMHIELKVKYVIDQK